MWCPMMSFHCHSLHGFNNGPAALQDWVTIARIVEEDGEEVIVATPYANDHQYGIHRIVDAIFWLNAKLDSKRTGGENYF